MNEFGLDDIENIGTPISKIKENNIKKDKIYNFTKHLETNLDNLNKKPNEMVKNTNIIMKEENLTNTNLLLVIYIVLFCLLNTELIINSIYYLINLSINPDDTNNQIITTLNLLLRTLLFGLILYLIKNYN